LLGQFIECSGACFLHSTRNNNFKYFVRLILVHSPLHNILTSILPFTHYGENVKKLYKLFYIYFCPGSYRGISLSNCGWGVQVCLVKCVGDVSVMIKFRQPSIKLISEHGIDLTNPVITTPFVFYCSMKNHLIV